MGWLRNSLSVKQGGLPSPASLAAHAKKMHHAVFSAGAKQI
jgi:hypothetical protein